MVIDIFYRTVRLICGDALYTSTVGALMDVAAARMAFSGPPYNMLVGGHIGNSGKILHRAFAVAAGEMSAGGFMAFLGRVFRNLAGHSVGGSIHFICMDWRHVSEIKAAGQGAYHTRRADPQHHQLSGPKVRTAVRLKEPGRAGGEIIVAARANQTFGLETGKGSCTNDFLAACVRSARTST